MHSFPKYILNCKIKAQNMCYLRQTKYKSISIKAATEISILNLITTVINTLAQLLRK